MRRHKRNCCATAVLDKYKGSAIRRMTGTGESECWSQSLYTKKVKRMVMRERSREAKPNEKTGLKRFTYGRTFGPESKAKVRPFPKDGQTGGFKYQN